MVESYTFTGRTPKPWYKKLNPIWWVQNDDEQNLDSGGAGGGAPPDYMLGEPQWKRRLFWEFRNPFQHLRCYVLGVQDRNYTVTGRAPVLTTQRDDLPGEPWGVQWAILHGGDLWMPRPWFSLTFLGVFYAGWQPSGFFGFKTVGLWVGVPVGLVLWLLWLLWPWLAPWIMPLWVGVTSDLLP